MRATFALIVLFASTSAMAAAPPPDMKVVAHRVHSLPSSSNTIRAVKCFAS